MYMKINVQGNICYGVYPKLFLWTYLSKFSRHHLSKFAPNSSATGDKVQEEWCYCGTTSDELCESKILFLLPLFLMKFSACGKCRFKMVTIETIHLVLFILGFVLASSRKPRRRSPGQARQQKQRKQRNVQKTLRHPLSKSTLAASRAQSF